MKTILCILFIFGFKTALAESMTLEEFLSKVNNENLDLRITKSVMLDALKKDKVSKIVDDVDMEKIPAELITNFDQAEEAQMLIEKLQGSQKIAMQMRFVDDKTFEEIADSLKTSPVNVRQLITRGVKRLKELMDNNKERP